MLITNLKKLESKKLIVFDLDGTLVWTKSPMEKQMTALIKRLLGIKKVAIIGGGKYEVFQELFLKQLGHSERLFKNLFLFPTTATSFYLYRHGWKRIYFHTLTKQQRDNIKKTFERVFDEIGYTHPRKVYGEIIEDRKTQVTFSVYGQDLVKVLGRKGVLLKERWKREHTDTKTKIARLMAKYLPDFEVHAAGFTSVDVTKKGIDKAYGLEQIKKQLHIKLKDMVFVGDAIFPGGNDYAVVRTGVDYIQVPNPETTKKIILSIIGER